MRNQSLTTQWGCLHTEVVQNLKTRVAALIVEKLGNLSNRLGGKRETRSDLLKGNHSRARIYLIDLKGREAGGGEQKQGACKLQ